jgi:hypothetical protein
LRTDTPLDRGLRPIIELPPKMRLPNAACEAESSGHWW